MARKTAWSSAGAAGLKAEIIGDRMAARTRIIAFFVSSQAPKAPAHLRALEHWNRVRQEFALEECEFELRGCRLRLLGEQLSSLKSDALDAEGARAEWIVGPHRSQPRSAWLEQSADQIRDRYLRIRADETGLSITSDYTGSIPVYYSRRRHLSVSNLQPVVVLDSDSRSGDLCYESIFGFLKFSHYIWDETAFQHIRMQEPDSTYRFKLRGLELQKRSLETLRASSENHRNLTQNARAFADLNHALVSSAFEAEPRILLPLSSGYDSRLVLAGLPQAARGRTQTFTYGPPGAIDVEAARRLAKLAGVTWSRVELPCRFLEGAPLRRVSLTMGGALHFHGMYQFEFFEIALRAHLPAVVTSGFMTGVPAGQHQSLLGIESESANLTKAMHRFAQSNSWSISDIVALSPKFDREMVNAAESRFRAAFERAPGEPFQKAVVFDNWTRQRQFISYYPRTLEWCLPVISPHMTPIYQNFFLGLPREQLHDRRVVEAMLAAHQPDFAQVLSNSNGLRAISNPMLNVGVLAARVMRRAGLGAWVPGYLRDAPLTFDVTAVRSAGLAGLDPVFADGSGLAQLFAPEQLQRLGAEMMQEVEAPGCRGSGRYQQLVTLQAIAADLALCPS